MTSMQTFQLLRPPLPPFVHSRPTFFHFFDIGRPISNKPSSSNDNQPIKSKHNPRMTIIWYQVLPSGRFQYQLINIA